MALWESTYGMLTVRHVALSTSSFPFLRRWTSTGAGGAASDFKGVAGWAAAEAGAVVLQAWPSIACSGCRIGDVCAVKAVALLPSRGVGTRRGTIGVQLSGRCTRAEGSGAGGGWAGCNLRACGARNSCGETSGAMATGLAQPCAKRVLRSSFLGSHSLWSTLVSSPCLLSHSSPLSHLLSPCSSSPWYSPLSPFYLYASGSSASSSPSSVVCEASGAAGGASSARSASLVVEPLSSTSMMTAGVVGEAPRARLPMGLPTVVQSGMTLEAPLAYELIQGPLVRWSVVHDRRSPAPPTAVLLHGILGGRRNWASFARRLAQEFPSWQFLVVDLRCHGDSTKLPKHDDPSVASAAADVLRLVADLRITPRMLVGHSFGGKVALSMIDQAAKPLARPVRVWVLDSTPGKVRSGLDGEDAPADIINALREMPQVVPSRGFVVNTLIRKGFSRSVAQWMTTNLRPIKLPGFSTSLSSTSSACGASSYSPFQSSPSSSSLPSPSSLSPSAVGTMDRLPEVEAGLSWVFDLEGIARMYLSYQRENLWPLVDNVPEGVQIDFVRAERSLHRWGKEDVDRINAGERAARKRGVAGGVNLHVLEDAGHWVHTDNPEGLFRLMAPSFVSMGGRGEVGRIYSASHQQHWQENQPKQHG
ncbi:hypothetical protein CBR_g4880 [Chara braunii]|uniref:AB hydrolase-1 domain-containing protein n=1 Tax=Chara braunii TaxID=69332 RepID=A0A388KJ31_CHABU|nr:hypothetical protein CBR_g4880 [Chara braunii]|eukprot:GBG70052.1 hypothetical protein CBR_g4880 [Chara braunii]